VLDAVTIGALTHWKFTISNRPKKTSAFPQEDIPEVGKKFGQSFKSVNSSAPIVIGKPTQNCSFPPQDGMKNRVNSGKPKEEIPFSSMVILSEACQRGL
jgi:hypothetical protein